MPGCVGKPFRCPLCRMYAPPVRDEAPMTATAPIPAAEATPSMANRSDNEDQAPSEQAPAQAPSGQARSGEAGSGEAPAEAPARASSGEAALLSEPASAERELPARAGRSGVGSRLRGQIAENPLLTLFGTVTVTLLFIMFGTLNSRIDDTNHRIDRLEDAMLAGFAAQDAKIDEKFGELDAKFDEMNLKLTALIAALNATEAVDAALEGRLLQPDGGAGGAGPGGEPLEG